MKNLFYRLLIYLDSANETDTNYNIDLVYGTSYFRSSSYGNF